MGYVGILIYNLSDDYPLPGSGTLTKIKHWQNTILKSDDLLYDSLGGTPISHGIEMDARYTEIDEFTTLLNRPFNTYFLDIVTIIALANLR